MNPLKNFFANCYFTFFSNFASHSRVKLVETFWTYNTNYQLFVAGKRELKLDLLNVFFTWFYLMLIIKYKKL